jgi:hypothetical protein
MGLEGIVEAGGCAVPQWTVKDVAQVEEPRERGDQLPIYRRLVCGMPEAWEGSWWPSADCYTAVIDGTVHDIGDTIG